MIILLHLNQSRINEYVKSNEYGSIEFKKDNNKYEYLLHYFDFPINEAV